MYAHPLNDLSTRDVVRGIKQGTFTAESVTQVLIARHYEDEALLATARVLLERLRPNA